MDDLHSLLSRIRTETKPEIKASPKPLDVFREFLAHLDQIQRQARAAPGRAILAEAAPDVADWLNTHAHEIMPALERRGAGRVSFQAGDFAREGFDVRSL